MKIEAKVSNRVLKKADSLFQGTVNGRISEILQNCRRAGATDVKITQAKPPEDANRDDQYEVVVEDNGYGIQDWAKLLHLGESGWDETIEKSEDPAGIGLFSLTGRTLMIQSLGKVAVIEGGAWFGEGEIEVREDTSSNPMKEGTRLTFMDQTWYATYYRLPSEPSDAIEEAGAFGGMLVSFNGTYVPNRPFIPEGVRSTFIKELGVRIAVVGSRAHRDSNDDKWAAHSAVFGSEMPKVSLNFHGQLLDLTYHHYDTVSFDALRIAAYRYRGEVSTLYETAILIDMVKDAETPIRLMLPARTRLVENDAARALADACNKQLLRRFVGKTHSLPYRWYRIGVDLGLNLEEAEAKFELGSAPGERGNVDYPDRDYGTQKVSNPIRVSAECEVAFHHLDGDIEWGGPPNSDVDYDFQTTGSARDAWRDPVMQTIHDNFDAEDNENRRIDVVTVPTGFWGYSWCDTDEVDFIEITPVGDLGEYSIRWTTVTVVESIRANVGTTDGEVYVANLPVCYFGGDDDKVYVTKDELETYSRLLFYYCGGLDDDEDYSQQEKAFEDDIRMILDEMIGVHEGSRRVLVDALADNFTEIGQQCAMIDDGDEIHLFKSVREVVCEETTTIKPDGTVSKRLGGLTFKK